MTDLTIPTNPERKKILIVDDRPASRLLLKQTLEGSDLDFVEVNSGEEALSTLHKESCFLILVEGIEAASLIRGHQKFSSIPIIFITDKDSLVVPKDMDCKSAALDYLIKPIHPDILKSKVRVFLDLCEKTSQLESKNKIITQQNKILERSNSQLQDFAHTVSHDLKSPLSIIHGILELSMSDEGLKAETYSMLERCIKSAQRMTRLIDDVLNYSENSLKKGHVENVDLNICVADVLDDLENQIKEKSAKIELKRLPCTLGVKTQFYQVFLNLISNALKFSKKGTSPIISIYCTKVESQRLQQNSEICKIIVEDNGIGIKEDYLSKIFTPFNRLHSQDQYEGSGIGLATIKNIIDAHFGSITVKSRLDLGSTFIITLPTELPDKNNPYLRNGLRIICEKEKIIKCSVYQSTHEGFSFTLVDESQGGMRGLSDKSANFKVGDLLNLASNQKYEIRWIKEKGQDQFEFGLKNLL